MAHYWEHNHESVNDESKIAYLKSIHNVSITFKTFYLSWKSRI